jgi:hypothetical protein
MLTTSRISLSALAVAAIAAPSAAAQPIEPSLPSGDDHGPMPQVVTRTVTVESGGFDWGDAGIGAAGMLSVLAVGAGAVVVVRRGQRSHATIS